MIARYMDPTVGNSNKTKPLALLTSRSSGWWSLAEAATRCPAVILQDPHRLTPVTTLNGISKTSGIPK